MPDIDPDDPVRGASEPDRYWTTTNIAEATPELLSPMCWDLWSGWDQAWLNAMYDFGLLARSERISSTDPNKKAMGVIYGRQAANVGVIRKVMGRLPGVKPDDVELSLLGSVRPGLPPEEGAGWRGPVIAVKLPWVMLRTKRLVRRMHDDTREWWIKEVATAATIANPLELLEDAAVRFITAAEMHSRVRFLIPVAERAVTTTAQKAGVTDVSALTGGLGNVAETVLADDLWRVSREELALDEFLREHGFHGPNEGNAYTKSWREQPQRVVALLESYRRRSDMKRPRDMEHSAIQTQRRAFETQTASSSGAAKLALKTSLDRLGSLMRSLELTKASYLRALDAARAAIRAIGDEQQKLGTLEDREDAFFLTRPEHHALAQGRVSADAARAAIAHRRAERARYAQFSLPISFTGMPELTASPAAPAESPDSTSITGAAGGCGAVQGRARVVLDPNDDVDLEPGDILVCRYTDPSWAPLFVCAAALVIDIGTAVSHGAVVARELGIPYVIGTGNGTAVIREGDQILVDGSTQSVTVLARSDVT